MIANSLVRKVLCIDLTNKTFESKSFSDFGMYFGGVGLGLKLFELYRDRDPIVFAIGPLNGFFPFVSKTVVVLSDAGAIEDIYLGGALSFRLKFGGVDAVLLLGKAEEPVALNILNDSVEFESPAEDTATWGLPGKRSTLQLVGEHFVLDDYFVASGGILGKKIKDKNVTAVVVTGAKTFSLVRVARYKELYARILAMQNTLEVQRGPAPSCAGCPLGCEKSRFGEVGGNILGHCLVACGYAQNIYSDANIVFSCLNVLGYDYKHEDIENVPSLVEDLLKSL